MSKLTDVIETKISKDVEELGYTVEYVENVKEGSQKILRVVIDKENESLTTEDCEVVSRKVEDKIDKLMQGDDSYVLEVSSPGLERQLKNDKLYNKYIGYEVRIKLYKKYENIDSKEVEGVLQNIYDNYIVLKINDDEIEIKKEDIACGNTVYKF